MLSSKPQFLCWLRARPHCPSSSRTQEITPESRHALGLLADAGIPLGNQSVLMAGVNDCPHLMMSLVHRLVEARVRPYYVYQCDEVTGAAHYRTPVSKGIEIMEHIRGHTSGLCVPSFIVDCPHGGGKVPILPNYLISLGEKRAVLRNFEGFITVRGPLAIPPPLPPPPSLSLSLSLPSSHPISHGCICL